MQHEFNKYLSFHREKGGTGKIYKFEFIEHKDGFLKLKGESTSQAIIQRVCHCDCNCN